MKRRSLWATGVVLLVVGLAGVVAMGTVYAEDENASRAKCSEATLHGTYLFGYDGVDVTGNKEVPFVFAGYDIYDGNGKIDSVVSSNFNGQVLRKEPNSGTYTVKANCTGTATFGDLKFDLFIAPDGSMFSFVLVKPSEEVAAGFEERATAKRVAP